MRKQLEEIGDRQDRETPEFFRKTFRTIATNAAIPQSEAPICLVMGIEIEGIKRHYIEAISDDRLIAVSEAVRAYYFVSSVPMKQQLETDAMLERTLHRPLARLTHETNQVNTLQIN